MATRKIKSVTKLTGAKKAPAKRAASNKPVAKKVALHSSSAQSSANEATKGKRRVSIVPTKIVEMPTTAQQNKIKKKQERMLMAMSEVIGLEKLVLGRDLTFAECAALFGVSRTTFANIVAGTVWVGNSDVQTQEKIALGLKTSRSNLLHLCGYIEPKDHFYKLNHERDMLTRYKAMIAQGADFMHYLPTKDEFMSAPINMQLGFLHFFNVALGKNDELKSAALFPEEFKNKKVKVITGL